MRTPWLGLFAVAVHGCAAFGTPKPVGTPGPEAETMAHALESAVRLDAWQRTRAVRWDFDGRRAHLWDRDRDFVRVTWGELEVLLRINTRDGVVTKAGERLAGEAAREALDAAYAAWINDSFWLNPIAKLYDAGVERGVATLKDGTQGLLVSYSSGGLTPGDAYLWTWNGTLPGAWYMWVSVIPVPGVRATWDDWVTLSTGALVSTRHEIGPKTLKLLDVRGAATLTELEPDPFGALLH